MKKLLGLLLVLVFMTGCGIEQVDEGFRGIKTNWGKVEGEPLNPGLYFYNPISSSIFEIEVREQKVTGTASSFTRDTQTVDVEFSLTYYPDSEEIANIYSQFGKGWEAKIVHPAVVGSLKDAIGQFIADDLVSKREEVKAYAFNEIMTSLKERKVTVTRLDLTNLDFQPAYESAVEAKVVAIQRAHEAKNKTVQIQEQAKQTVLSAQADAESMRIRSAALSQNKSLVEYEAVQKWDGKLPQYILGGGSVPFIDLNKLGK